MQVEFKIWNTLKEQLAQTSDLTRKKLRNRISASWKLLILNSGSCCLGAQKPDYFASHLCVSSAATLRDILGEGRREW